MLDYGYRSKCCYAPIRIGTKKVRNTTINKQVWICTRCRKSDVSLVQYTSDRPSGSSPLIPKPSQFASDDEPEIKDELSLEEED